ncbi:hypothetical protein CJ030_MR5G024628 [Morella rubra]|uniref:Protein APEM9 n=1 Tax=Morella rubra TaxID=262757 RepID=A0A6A1VJP6_9ROSI|nr:hypothetical protein CJ030_MR5G024628 [Morella rubra]
MAATGSNRAIWEEIELSESYLVCSMYEEAASLASSTLKRLCCDNEITCTEAGEDVEFYDMLDSTGMVLVQSLKGLGRTSEILNQLKLLYISVSSIPVQVLLTGTCFQISENSSFGVREFLEEFLSKWSFVDEQYYVLLGAEENADRRTRCGAHSILQVDEYLEVVEVYVMKLLATILNDLNSAISWVEKASIPEEKRQLLLRKLHSLHSLKVTNLSKGSSPSPGDNHDARLSSLKELNVSEGSPKALKAKFQPKQENVTKQAVSKLTERVEPCIWWFRTITFKFGNAQLVVSNRKIVLGCLLLLMCQLLRKKKAALKRIAGKQVMLLKKAVTDFWQLAFSYQVNPLAAVQPLAAATRGGQ